LSISEKEWDAETEWINKFGLANSSCPLLFAPLAIDSPFQDWNPLEIGLEDEISHQEELFNKYVSYIGRLSLNTKRFFLGKKLKIQLRLVQKSF